MIMQGKALARAAVTRRSSLGRGGNERGAVDRCFLSVEDPARRCAPDVNTRVGDA